MKIHLHTGDLVVTPYHDYGIYLGGTDVFLANGLRVVFTKAELDGCITCPTGKGNPSTRANFIELVTYYEQATQKVSSANQGRSGS